MPDPQTPRRTLRFWRIQGEFWTGLVGTGKASVSLRDLRGLDDKGGRVNGGKVRQLANYVSRKIGTPGTRRGQLITQAQVKF
jgi:hypothetical protein